MLLTTSSGSSISWFLQRVEDIGHLPSEEWYLLRVSSRVLRHLASTYHIPSAFLAAVSLPLDLYGTAFRRQSQHEWDYWCRFPFRVAIGGNGQRSTQVNPMDPSYHIYFEGQQLSIYGSTMALYMKRDCKTGKTHVFVVNNGGKESIQRPLAQVHKSLEQRSSVDLDGNPCFVLLIYISFMLKWWNVALRVFNTELVAHVSISRRIVSVD